MKKELLPLINQHFQDKNLEKPFIHQR